MSLINRLKSEKDIVNLKRSPYNYGKEIVNFQSKLLKTIYTF